jgi:hypothetical protein
MNLLPDKHLSIGTSLLGVGATILRKLNRPSSVTGLWDRCRQSEETANFGRFIQGLDLLFALGAVEIQNEVLVKIR